METYNKLKPNFVSVTLPLDFLDVSLKILQLLYLLFTVLFYHIGNVSGSFIAFCRIIKRQFSIN